MVYYSVSGSATNGVDYNWLTGSVRISYLDMKATIRVTSLDDSLYEHDEDVMITLLPNSAYELGEQTTATARIISDDLPPFVPQLVSTLSLSQPAHTVLNFSVGMIGGAEDYGYQYKFFRMGPDTKGRFIAMQSSGNS